MAASDNNTYVISVERSDIKVTVEIEKDTEGHVLSTKASALASNEFVNTSAIKEAVEKVGGDFDILITVGTLDIVANSDDIFTVRVNTSDLLSGKTMKVYDVTDASTEDDYIIVNESVYTVGSSGLLYIPLAKARSYRLFLTSDAVAIDKKIKNAVKAEKKSYYMALGKTYTMKLASQKQMSSIKTISYTSSDSRVALVDTDGIVTAKGLGTAVITGIVTYNDASTSEISTTINVVKNAKQAIELNKKANPLKVKNCSYTVKVSSKRQSSTAPAIIPAKKIKKNVTRAIGKVSFKKSSGDSKITISKKGKVIVKKGIKTGKTYTMKVKVTAAGNSKYRKAQKTGKIKIKVMTK